jgi:hypothetical protein
MKQGIRTYVNFQCDFFYFAIFYFIIAPTPLSARESEQKASALPCRSNCSRVRKPPKCVTKRKLGVSQRWDCSCNFVKGCAAAFGAARAGRSPSSIRPIHCSCVLASDIPAATEFHVVFIASSCCSTQRSKDYDHPYLRSHGLVCYRVTGYLSC